MRGIPARRGLQKLMAKQGVKQITMGLALLIPATAFMARVPELSSSSVLTNATAQQTEETKRAGLVSAVFDDEVNATGAVDEVVASLAAEFKVPVPLAQDIHEAAVSASIDPKVAFGLVRAESRFRATIVSPVGAVGLTQVMPATAKWLVPGTTKADLTDPETNLKVGFTYLRSLLDRFEGNEKLALTAYNRGPGTVSKILDRGGDPDNGYAEMVLTGKSTKHVRLMNAKFGTKHHVVKKKRTTTRTRRHS